MRLWPLELYLANLEGWFESLINQGYAVRGYSTKEEAYESLKRETGEDFGYDVEVWKRHIDAHGGPKNYRRHTPRPEDGC